MRFVKIPRIIASVVLVAYLFVPFIDSAACEDCINPVKSTLDKRAPYGATVFSVSTVKASAIESSTQSQTRQKGFCQVCFSTAKLINTENIDVVLSPVFCICYLPRLTTPILAYALFRPPEI